MPKTTKSVFSDEKFSFTAYSHQWKAGRVKSQRPSTVNKDKQTVAGSLKKYQRLIDDIRSELVQLQGRTEEEQKQNSELINRAVLGFEEERLMLLAMIQDMLIQKRVHDEVPPERSTYHTLAEAVFAEVIGLNVLELVLKAKEQLEEVQVVGPLIYEVKGGIERLSPFRFDSIQDVERIQQNLVLFNKDVLNQTKRWAEVMLSDGSRVTMTGFGFTAEPTLTIRFFNRHQFHLFGLCETPYETLDEDVMNILQAILHARFNLVVIGATNTGKTHLIKSMIAELPDHERIVTIESRFELKLKRDFPTKNIVEYEVDDEDRLHSSQQAFKLALRQSPKRIIHAEIRDEDANIYVRACTRGHEGSITTVHVNELEDAPDAIVDMCMLDGRGMDPERLRRRITEYVTQIGIEMSIVSGQRKLVRIAEFMMEGETVVVRDLVTYDYTKRRWELKNRFSQSSSQKIYQQAKDSFEQMAKLKLVCVPC